MHNKEGEITSGRFAYSSTSLSMHGSTAVLACAALMAAPMGVLGISLPSCRALLRPGKHTSACDSGRRRCSICRAALLGLHYRVIRRSNRNVTRSSEQPLHTLTMTAGGAAVP